MGLGQYNSLGEYCDPHTASSVFLILLWSFLYDHKHIPSWEIILENMPACVLRYSIATKGATWIVWNLEIDKELKGLERAIKLFERSWKCNLYKTVPDVFQMTSEEQVNVLERYCKGDVSTYLLNHWSLFKMDRSLKV